MAFSDRQIEQFIRQAQKPQLQAPPVLDEYLTGQPGTEVNLSVFNQLLFEPINLRGCAMDLRRISFVVGTGAAGTFRVGVGLYKGVGRVRITEPPANTDEKGRPLELVPKTSRIIQQTLGGAQLDEYAITLPNPIRLLPTDDYYIGYWVDSSSTVAVHWLVTYNDPVGGAWLRQSMLGGTLTTGSSMPTTALIDAMAPGSTNFGQVAFALRSNRGIALWGSLGL